MAETAWILVSPRGLFRGGRMYEDGDSLEVPVHALPTIMGRTPPHGWLIDPEALTRPKAVDLPEFTDAALRELRRAGFHESVYDGEASGADDQVLVEDVRDWLPADVVAWLSEDDPEPAPEA